MKNKNAILIFLFLVLLTVFASCNNEPDDEEQTVNTVWKNIILTNPTDYNLPDEIDGVLTFIMSDARTFESVGRFVMTDNGNYILNDSLILPTDENLLYLFIKIDVHGWILKAELPPYSVKEYTCKDTLQMEISCGRARISYLSIDSVSETSVDLTYKLEDLGVDSVIDILVRVKNLDETEEHNLVFPAECGVYSASFDGLTAGESYLCQIYAHNFSGYKYLRDCYFETLEGYVPLTAETWDVSNITRTTASLSGTILFSGDETTVVERGFIWGTNAELDYTQNIGIKICGNGVGPFFATISNLTPSVTYFTRAYAKNADSEIVYGEVISFTTLDITPPIIGTIQLYSITSSTAYCSSVVSDDGGSPITDKGFVYSFSNDPSLESFFGITHHGAGVGGIARTIVDLWPNRTYYICAYAVTSFGTYYGDVTVFTTAPLIEK